MSTPNEIGVYNEWGKLKEVVVGIVPDNRIIVPPPSYSHIQYMHPDAAEMLRKNQGTNAWESVPEVVAMAQQQIEGLVNLYEEHGVKVHRSRPWTEDEEKFLAFVQPGGLPLYARDPILVAGKNVIELSLMIPMRRKEIFAIREILERRVAEDPEAYYVSVPQPSPHRITEDMPEGPGPFLEGGDIFVMGQDVLVGNSGLASNRTGIEWLRRYLAPQGYRLHEVPLTGRWLHLDCVFALVRHGLAMADLSAFKNGLPDLFTDWQIIEASSKEAHKLGVNIVCLEENVVAIGEEHQRLIKELEKHGAEVLTTPMDVASTWGGGIRYVAKLSPQSSTNRRQLFTCSEGMTTLLGESEAKESRMSGRIVSRLPLTALLPLLALWLLVGCEAAQRSRHPN